jgi:hypothetical protein
VISPVSWMGVSSPCFVIKLRQHRHLLQVLQKSIMLH